MSPEEKVKTQEGLDAMKKHLTSSIKALKSSLDSLLGLDPNYSHKEEHELRIVEVENCLKQVEEAEEKLKATPTE